MFGFLKDRFEKQAQAAIERRARELAPGKAVAAAKAAQPAGPRQSGSERGAESEREAAIARMQAQVQDFVTPERQALLDNARAVMRAKRQILDQLDDESRAKLVAMAVTTLLHQGPPPKKK